MVLDSSAMLAYLNGESGGDIVRDLLADEELATPIYAHAVNLTEVFYDFLRSQDATTAEEAISTLLDAGVVERNDMDSEFWHDVGTLIGTRRKAGGRLALGDAFGLALARRLGAELYTSDRHELEPLEAAGIAKIKFIR